MSCYSSEHNCQNPQPCDCNCTSTTTVACQAVAEKPCSVLYDELFLSDCIIYDGPDNSCYGVKNGDSVKKVFEIIFNKLQGQDCDCNFGNAVISPITDDPNTLCINIMTDSSNICQNVVNQSITSGVVINGKVSYQFIYQGKDYIIKWSNTSNRWEIFLGNNLSVPLAYLNSNTTYPIGPLAPNISWISNTALSTLTYVSTRESCPQPICVSIYEENIQFNSYYDTVYNNIYKHAYVSCTGNYTIKWNPFMLVYELFDGITKIATTTVGDLETTGYINWLPVGEMSPIKSKKGICPATPPPPSTTSTTTIVSCSQAICGQTYEGYGYLYNWFVTQNSNLPGGLVNIYQPYTDERNQWRVSTDEDWSELACYLDPECMPSVEGVESLIAANYIKTTCSSPFTTNNGLWILTQNEVVNSTKLAIVPNGYRYQFGLTNGLTADAIIWTSSERSSNTAWSRYIIANNGEITRQYLDKQWGGSIRLVRPATTSELLLADGTTSNDDPSLPPYIGNTRGYITVKIGNQIWTAQNLIEEKYNDGTSIPEVTDDMTWSSLTTGARCSYNNGIIEPEEGQIELCGTTDVVPTCCAPVIDVVQPVGSGPGVSVTYIYPGTDLCIDCTTVTIEYSLDGGLIWNPSSGPCNDSPRTVLDDISGTDSVWRAKTSCVGGGESEYSQIYTYIS